MSKGFTLVELMVVIGILGLLVGILAVAVVPKLLQAKKDLEIKQLGDIKSAFDQISIDNTKTRALNKDPLKSSSGRKFYDLAFKEKLFDSDILGKIVSKGGPDSKADTTVLDKDSGVELAVESCSYTAPKGSELLALMKAKGKNRKVLLTFNSRNWLNYEEYGTIVQWSDGEQAEYLTKDQAKTEFQIDSDTWTSNPKDVIGNKPPFDKTFE